MYLKCNRRFKDGKEHRYWSLVESRRCAGGQVVQRPVLYLGEINDSQRESWCRTIEAFDPQQDRTLPLALFPADRPVPAHAAAQKSSEYRPSQMDNRVALAKPYFDRTCRDSIQRRGVHNPGWRCGGGGDGRCVNQKFKIERISAGLRLNFSTSQITGGDCGLRRKMQTYFKGMTCLPVMICVMKLAMAS
jgi:hypothetical protein